LSGTRDKHSAGIGCVFSDNDEKEQKPLKKKEHLIMYHWNREKIHTSRVK
jgi:hypothetical protein